APPAAGESLASWGEARFGGDRFSVVAYRAEQFDASFALAVGRVWSQILEGRGMNAAGQEVFVFAGNYDRTPFGVHQDRDQGATVHLHLGPGTKRMFLW